MSRLLLEIGTEAIPAGYVPPALAALEDSARAGLADLRLGAQSVRAAGTAKRLVLEVRGLAARQTDLTREVTGPRADAAFRDGKATPAAEGFARKNGVPVEALERVTTDKGEFVMVRVHETGRDAREVLPDLLSKLVQGLPWPKTMTWNASRFRFPRPIRWVVCLLDDAILPLAVAGIDAKRETQGHRLIAPGPHGVVDAGRLDSTLELAGVLLDPEARRARIVHELEAEAKCLGGRLVPDEGLLREVVFLAEWPRVLSGSFDAKYLELPREVVVTAMRSHQRYFAVEDTTGRLKPNFLVVCDGEWEDVRFVIAGNERVLRARLEDARFYWKVDLKTGLDRLAESLGSVVWLESIGTLREKSERVAALVDRLGREWYAADWPARREVAMRAARLAKADLSSEMIKDGKEFTGLQGIMGARYAEASGEPAGVVSALAEQYLPRGAADPLPLSVEGMLLALADRLDTIAGCWAAGFVPSGSQDPYALRRAGNGVVRMVLEKELHLSLSSVLEETVGRLPEAARREGLTTDLTDFFRDRTAYFLRERGITYDVVDAVLAADADDPLDALARANALNAIRGEEALERLVIGFKRAANILKGIDERSLPDPAKVDWAPAHPTERLLHEAALAVGEKFARDERKSASAGRGLAHLTETYAAKLRDLLELREPIDRFFDDVMVMSEDPVERDRRLAVLAEARGFFHHLFDPARIVIEGEGAAVS